MDIPQVLAVLRPDDDWGPCANTDNTYTELAAKWRGINPVPSEAEMLAAWATIVTNGPALAYAALKVAALELFQNQTDKTARALRAILPLIRTEFNRHRKRAREQNAAVAAATSLADLKSRWATVATNNPAADLSVEEVRDAIIDAINSTDSD